MNPGKFSESSLSHLRKTPFCDIERALQKGNFCSFAEKDRGLDPQDLPSCTPARVEIDCFSKLSCIRKKDQPLWRKKSASEAIWKKQL